MTSPKLPTGETLPEYDDGPADGVDLAKIQDWLVANRGVHVDWVGDSRTLHVIRSIIDALQAVSDATLVKNQTYRAMRADGARVEKLAAWLANHGMHDVVLDADGDPVEGAITALTTAREYVAGQAEALMAKLGPMMATARHFDPADGDETAADPTCSDTTHDHTTSSCQGTPTTTED